MAAAVIGVRICLMGFKGAVYVRAVKKDLLKQVSADTIALDVSC